MINKEELYEYNRLLKEVIDRYFSLEELCPTNYLLKFMEHGKNGGLCFVRESRTLDELFKRFGKGFPELEEIRQNREISKFDYHFGLAVFALRKYNSEMKDEICQIESMNIFEDWGVKI